MSSTELLPTLCAADRVLGRHRTQFRLDEPVADSQVVGGDGLPVDHPKQREFGRQRVHDHGQVSLPNLSTHKAREEQAG